MLDEDHSVEIIFGNNTSMLDWLKDVKSSLSVWVTNSVDRFCQVPVVEVVVGCVTHVCDN